MREAMRGYPSHVSPFHRRRSRLFFGVLGLFWFVVCSVGVVSLSTMPRSI